MPCADKADELQNHDQRSGRRFRQAEAIEHFGRAEPLIVFNGLLGDVREDGISAPEGYHGGFAEKQALLRNRVIPSEEYASEQQRREPKGDAHDDNLERARPRRTRMFERGG